MIGWIHFEHVEQFMSKAPLTGLILVHVLIHGKHSVRHPFAERLSPCSMSCSLENIMVTYVPLNHSRHA